MNCVLLCHVQGVFSFVFVFVVKHCVHGTEHSSIIILLPLLENLASWRGFWFPAGGIASFVISCEHLSSIRRGIARHHGETPYGGRLLFFCPRL